MNGPTALRIARDLINLLESDGIMGATDFDETKLDTIQEDVAFAAHVEAVLKKNGVLVPGSVDRIIQLLPIIASFIR